MLLHFIDPGIFCAGLSCKCTVRQETKAKKKTRNNFFTLAKQKQNEVASTIGEMCIISKRGMRNGISQCRMISQKSLAATVYIIEYVQQERKRQVAGSSSA